jgi:hypothetical protein
MDRIISEAIEIEIQLSINREGEFSPSRSW